MEVVQMAVLNTRAHRMAALAVASLLSSTVIANAATKIVLVTCAVGFSGTAITSCDKSTGVAASCPASGTSCAQAVAVFESAPDNLRLMSIVSPAQGVLVHTLGIQTND